MCLMTFESWDKKGIPMVVDAIIPDVQAGERVLNFAIRLLAPLNYWEWLTMMVQILV